MLKINLLVTLLITFVFQSVSQGEYDKCYFGTAAVDFGNWFPSVLSNSGMEALESAASVCSPQGDLLFYSNGGNSPTIPGMNGAVWNANHQIMENGVLGDSSGCVSSYHGAIAIPSPANNDLKKTGSNSYYLFTRDCVESSFSAPNYNSGLTYCLIDMNENGGLGKVVEKNQIVVPFSGAGYSIKTSHEPIAAVRNVNDVDWWIFSYNKDSLYSIELTELGVENYQPYDIAEGAIVVSPRRDKLLAGEKLYGFDASNGQVNYLMTLDVGSASFSSDGTKLYSLFGNKLFQYDIEANDIINSKVEIASLVGVNRLYLAPDRRIYLFKSNSNSIPGYIQCPNNDALNVGVTMNALNLSGKESGDSFTNIPACFLYNASNQCNVSVEDIESTKNYFSIAPNPADKEFRILNGSSKKINTIKILNSKGRLIMSVNSDFDKTVNISGLSSGLYFVYSLYDDEVFVNKLIVK
jgi:hypothetical protein